MTLLYTTMRMLRSVPLALMYSVIVWFASLILWLVVLASMGLTSMRRFVLLVHLLV